MNSTTLLKSLGNVPGPHVSKTDSNLKDVEGDLARFQLEMHKRYGQLVKFNLDKTQALSTTDVNLLRELSTESVKSEQLYQFSIPLIGNVLERGESSKKLRAFIANKFSAQLLKRNFDKIAAILNTEIDNWLACSRNEKGIIELQKRIKTFALRVSILLVSGHDFSESEYFAEAIHTALEELLKSQYHKKGQQKEKLRQALDYINQKTNEFINERKETSTPNPVFIDELLNFEPFKNNPNDILDITKLVLIASHHTISSVICWTLYALAKYPDVANKIYNEVDSIKANKADHFENIHQYKYLPIVIKEVLRLFPAGPYTARNIPRDISEKGATQNMFMLYPIWAVHKAPDYWVEPESFKPERFHENYNKFAYMPFGLGARACPGENMANAEVLALLSIILKRVSVKEIPNFEPIFYDNFVLESKNGIKLQISPRDKKAKDFKKCDIPALLSLLAVAILSNKKDATMLSLFICCLAACHYLYKNNSTLFADNNNVIKSDEPSPYNLKPV